MKEEEKKEEEEEGLEQNLWGASKESSQRGKATQGLGVTEARGRKCFKRQGGGLGINSVQ